MAEADPTALCFAGFTLDPAARTLMDAAGREVPLRRSEYELLRAFLAAPGRALSRDHLLDAVASRHAEPFDRSVDVLVGRLRRKLESEPGRPRLIVTVPGAGYRFAVKPQPASAEGAATPVAEPAPSPAPPASPERRQLTVMHCGLCGPTLLAARRDPEDLQRLLAIFHEHAKSVLTEAGGTVDRLLGDGLVAYFGHPRADEHQAERAVHAALELIEAAGGTDTGPLGQLQVRVGVATGLAVVGGQPSAPGQLTALGEAIHLAAGLASRAEPGAVLISASTRRLVGELFEFRAYAPIPMEGVGEPVEAWQVTAEAAAESRFEALRGTALVPLVGREEELGLLLRRWEQAKAGSGKVVLITGEPGIGKSRLARAFQDAIAGQPHTELRLFCSPHHQDSALHPLIVQLEHAAGFAREDTDEAKLAKLDAGLAPSNATDEAAALIAELLSIPTDQRERVQRLSPQARRERTLAALLAQLAGLAARQPVLVIYEDVHWIDPTSRELLDRTIEQVKRLPVLLLATFRPEFQPPWIGQPNVTPLALSRLDPYDSAAMIAEVAGADALPAEMAREIAERADGVPLFVEELTKAVIEAGAQAPAALSSAPHPGLAVPATLHASLMARLDRLGPDAKEVAQTGAAIGREFGHGLLASTTDLSEPHLCEALGRLTNAGLVFARGAPPQSVYLFKHALVQDAAYSTLLRSGRQQLHARIATTLEEHFDDIVLAQPALLAQHYSEAGLAEKAVVYRLKAGRQALARSAMPEAAAQLRKGLDVLASLPDGPWRRQQELDLQVELRSALTATKGWAVAEVEETLARARVLAEQLERPEHLVPLILGQWSLHHVRAEHRLALPVGEQLEQIGEARNDAAVQWLGRFAQGVTRFMLGEFVAARALLERYLGLADPSHRVIGGLSFDPHAATLAWLAPTLACLGCIDQAQSRMDEALSEARRLQHVYTVGQMLLFASLLDRLTGSPLMHLEELQSLATEHNYPLLLAFALALRGGSLIALGQAQEGLMLCTQALTKYRAMGHVIGTARLFASLAVAHASLGQPDEARDCLAEAARIIGTTEERYPEAEVLHRVPGDLLNAAGDRSGAERHYRQAIVIAERQSARLFQLRAFTSLARLWRDQGRRTEAYDLLVPIYGWFTEGFDAPVLKEAKALLDELA